MKTYSRCSIYCLVGSELIDQGRGSPHRARALGVTVAGIIANGIHFEQRYSHITDNGHAAADHEEGVSGRAKRG